MFDLPLGQAFTYAVPAHLAVAPGQRVLAPLGGAVRAGLIVALVEGGGERVKPLADTLEPRSILSGGQRVGERLHALPRSEEHTSELQSHSDLVCRLLLEKKKEQAPSRHA